MKKLKLTDPQLCYLRIMYNHKIFPGTEPEMSGKIIELLVRNFAYYFSKYTVEELVEDFYALAQPWMIDVPLIECRGNIGNPEDAKYMWSNAASPNYTTAVLTEAGVKYVKENKIMDLNFC